MVEEQRSIESKLNRVVLVGNRGDASITKAELASLQIKKHQALVVMAKVKKNILWDNEHGPGITGQWTQACNWLAYCECHITRQVTSTYEQSHLLKFWQYFEKLFTKEPGLSSAQLDTYLTGFPRLTEI